MMNSLAAQQPRDSRDYTVTVDGKHAGTLKIDYVAGDDDSLEIFVRSDIECRVLFLKYTYSLHVRESWHNGQLLSLTGKVNDNGTNHKTQLRKSGKTFDVIVNDQPPQRVSECHASTTFAFCPKFAASMVASTLDIDAGTIIDVAWNDMGRQNVAVDGISIDGHHFRVADDCETQVWYDDSHRLIKQTFMDSGSQVMVVQTRRTND